VRPRGDSLPLRFTVDQRVLALTSLSEHPPLVFLMLTNATPDGFHPEYVTRLLGTEARRREVIKEIVDTTPHYGLAGVTIDFELLPPNAHPVLLRFLEELRPALQRENLLLTQAVPGQDPTWPVEKYALLSDRLFIMLYDETDASGDPGPIASARWFDRS